MRKLAKWIVKKLLKYTDFVVVELAKKVPYVFSHRSVENYFDPDSRTKRADANIVFHHDKRCSEYTEDYLDLSKTQVPSVYEILFGPKSLYETRNNNYEYYWHGYGWTKGNPPEVERALLRIRQGSSQKTERS